MVSNIYELSFLVCGWTSLII